MSAPDTDWMHNIEHRLGKGDERMGRMESKIDENTDLTRDIRDALIAGKFTVKAIKLVGALSIAGSAIWAGAYQLFHHGSLPK